MQVNEVRVGLDGIVLGTSNGPIRLQAIGSRIMRVTHTARTTFSDTPSHAVLPQQFVAPRLTEAPDVVTASAGQLTVVVDRASGSFVWLDADGVELVREPRDGHDTKILEPIDVVRYAFDDNAERITSEGVDGTRTTTARGRPYLDRQAYSTTVRLQFAAEETIYGLGQHDDGIFDYRGRGQDLYQQNMKVAIPVIVSTRGYALVWDSASLARFDDGPDGARFWTEVDDELDFYMILGPEFDDIMAGIRTLTGRVPMLPRWALGYIQSKERYSSQAELLDIVEEFRTRHIPLDCIVQDWRTWPDGQWGQKSFDPTRYPDPSALCNRLHASGVKLMVSIWPNMHNDGPNQVELRARGHLLGDDSTYDPWSAEARAMYWEQARTGYFVHGVDAWWADCTEPFEADWHGAVKPGPERRLDINVGEAKKYLDPEHLNAYSLLHTKGVFDGQRASDPDKRVTILTRSAWLGQQRYGATTWPGDISASWRTLRHQLADGMNFCLTGNPRWTFDTGGFFVGADPDLWFWSGDFPGGVDDLGYRELYVRWLQAAALMPMMRSHGTETPREPWRFGQPGEVYYDTILAYIRLRYRLLPYVYSLHARETRSHYTSLRALAFDFRNDRAVHKIADQFLLGPALMACPVLTPMHHGPGSEPLTDVARSRDVYLPAGTDWLDFWSGERLSGGTTSCAAAPLQTMPLFVRAGSIVPLGPVAQHTAQAAGGPLEIRVYPGADGEFELYQDDGDGYGYEAGDCTTTTMHWDDRRYILTIGTQADPRYAQQVRVVRVGRGQGIGATVSTDGYDVVLGASRQEVHLG